MRIIVNSAGSLSDCIGKLRKEYQEHKDITVNIITKKGRTLSQNAISHAWYSQVSKELADHSAVEIKRLCKYHLGIPILAGEDAEFCDVVEKIIKPLTYENRLLAMDFLPVTSRMNTQQLNQYLEAMAKNYIGRVELLFPEDT